MNVRTAIATVLFMAAAGSALADDAALEGVTPLPRVTVTAEHESDGYLVERSRTATKTDTPLIDVPQSVSVVARDLIRDQSMQSLADVARYVPGAGMAQGEGNRDTIILRGNSSTSDFFLDGVRDDVEYFRDLYNIDRVEILKGPNAMIFGRGGAGGVVNRVTRQANWQPVREVSLQGGSWDNRRATFDFGDAVTEDSRPGSRASTRIPRATATASSWSARASTRHSRSRSAKRRWCASRTSISTTTASRTAASPRSRAGRSGPTRRHSSAIPTRARPTRRSTWAQ